MDYADFVKLIKDGEKANVDFKIQLDAFGRDSLPAKAELAKDICALANNGNIVSYIVVGVSDDRKSFKSVATTKLTGDNLQDFCKTAVFPPPKVKLHWVTWKRASTAHKNKDFVVIQVGPQPREAFRLNKDFIDYKHEVCFRRNEVWIRRNATSDLATPEEIARLTSGKTIDEYQLNTKLQTEREDFARASQHEQIETITAATKNPLRNQGYFHLREKDGLEIHPVRASDRTYLENTFRKKIGRTVLLINTLICATSLTLEDLKYLQFHGRFDQWFSDWNEIARPIGKLTKREVRALRRIWLVPVIKVVSGERIAKAFPDARRLGNQLHFYRPRLRTWVHRKDGIVTLFPSSSELLIIDNIKSLSEYEERLSKSIIAAEQQSTTIISPPTNKNMKFIDWN